MSDETRETTSEPCYYGACATCGWVHGGWEACPTSATPTPLAATREPSNAELAATLREISVYHDGATIAASRRAAEYESRGGRPEDAQYPVALHRRYFTALRLAASRLDGAGEDTARLDWLFAALNDDAIMAKVRAVGNAYALRLGHGDDFRAAIDAAMRAPSPTEGGAR